MRLSNRLPALLCLLWCGVGAQAEDKVYTIDAAASEIHWLVYKAGALARLGHNHVVAADVFEGNVVVSDADLSSSRFEIVIPVGDLAIDDPTLRSGLGPDFASVPTAEDIAGTRRNMLTEAVLDGEKFPEIRLTGTGPKSAGAGRQTLALKVELLGRTVDLEVPTTVTVEPNRVEAAGEFELNHADLGMQPFSVMMGALQVGEKLSFSYRVVAFPAP